MCDDLAEGGVVVLGGEGARGGGVGGDVAVGDWGRPWEIGVVGDWGRVYTFYHLSRVLLSHAAIRREPERWLT